MTDIFEKCYDFKRAAEARKHGIYPFFRPLQESRGSKVVIEGRTLIMAGSNNYLGLAQDPRVEEAAVKAIEKYGTSCSGSRFINGSLVLHEELEGKLAAFAGKESVLCFSTGYQTNLGAISALVGRGEHIITDKYNHASIVDGIFMTMGMNRDTRVHRYKHNDLKDLEQRLAAIPLEEAKLIVTDGVFSMEGDIVKLPEVKALAEKYGARLYIDEAHAIGVIGSTGRGTTEHFNGSELADIIMCTFSKSFGSLGGFVAGDDRVIDYIRHFARPLIFSASMPPASIAAVLASLEIIEREPERVLRLQQIAAKMIKGFNDLGFNTGTAETAIIPLVIGDNDQTFLLWKALFERGVYVNPVISPAVPPNRSLIRTSYMAIHSDEELDQVLEITGEEGCKLGII
ncbi:4-hydroxy-2,2'-bipyrrole-5-methanol synthase PigH [subsurface metagenome]